MIVFWSCDDRFAVRLAKRQFLHVCENNHRVQQTPFNVLVDLMGYTVTLIVAIMSLRSHLQFY